MPPRACNVIQHRTTRRGWCHWLFSLLLLALTMLLGGQAMAHPEPASLSPVAAESSSPTSPTSPVPHCEHGHGWQHVLETLLRTERLDVDDSSTRRPDPAVTPPAVVTTIGIPSAAPTLADPPLYLLTQRLRP
ncbi:MAG: hypothetical protein JJU25_06040 [Halomonas sp.]|nr:hypothetical protein [Halomonas sp.]MCC5882183.1 hypothetical protein [Halomonas sp.]